MEYKCELCIKTYSSYKSLWNHNKKFHKPHVINESGKRMTNVIDLKKNVINLEENVINLEENKLSCKYCKRHYAARQNRWRHEKICKSKNINKDQIIINKPNTQINNNANNINNGQIYNNTTNTNNTTNIIKFGSTENIKSILNLKQIMKILDCRLLAVEESIKTIHFNKDLPEYQNIRINNLRSNIALIHDGNTFNVANQYNVINDLINDHVDIITELIEEHRDKLHESTIQKLEQFIEKLDDNYNKMKDVNTNRTFKNYKDYKIDKVKNIIYNESKKNITNVQN